MLKYTLIQYNNYIFKISHLLVVINANLSKTNDMDKVSGFGSIQQVS